MQKVNKNECEVNFKFVNFDYFNIDFIFRSDISRTIGRQFKEIIKGEIPVKGRMH